MPVENRYKLALNIKDKVNKYVPTVTAFDKTIFEFEVWDGGKLFELSDTYMYHLVTKSPGKNSVIREGSLTVSGLVEAEFSYSETQYLRPVDCALQIYDEDMNRITSMRFRVEIMDDLSREGGLPAESPRVIIADEELLTQAITDSSAAKTEVEQARGEEESLSARFDSVAAELERKASVNDISNLTVELSGKAEVTELYDIASRKADASDLQTVAAQLEDIAINAKTQGLIGDGIADDTAKFITACNVSLLLGVPLNLSKNTYKLNLTSDISVPSLIGHGAKLIINGDYSLLYGDNFRSIGVTFETSNVRSKTDTSYGNPILKNKSPIVKNIGISDTFFVATGSEDGLTRGGIAFKSGIITGLYINNVEFKCFRQSFVIYGASNNIKGDNVRFYNVETGFYIGGSDVNSPGGSYAKDILLTKITHINTREQQSNYAKLQGADTIMLEKCDGVILTGFYCENVVERSVYANCIKNIQCDDFVLVDTEGVKFVGRVRYDNNLEVYAENCVANNIQQRMSNKTESFLLETYWSKNVHVNNVQMLGGSVSHVLIQLRHSVEDFYLNGAYVENLKRSVVEYVNEGTIVGNAEIPDNPEGNYPAFLKNVSVKNVKAKNVCLVGYEVFRVVELGTPLTAGNYRIHNLELENISVTNYDTDIFGSTDSTNVNCTGLLNLNNINGLRVKNCNIRGFKSSFSFPFQVGSNSKNIIIQHEEILREASKKFVYGTLHVSAGSELKFKIIERQRSYEDLGIITPIVSTLENVSTVDLSQRFTLEGRLRVKSNSVDSIVSIVGVDGSTTDILPNLMGNIDVTTDSGNRALFNITPTNSLTIQTGYDSSIFDNAGANEKLSVTKSFTGNAILLRDKRGNSSTIIVEYYISTYN